MRGFVHLRKAEYMFGWDWGPRLPDAGIWRDISLIGIDHARFDNIYVRQEHRDGKVILTFDTELDLVDELPYEIRISVETPSGEILTATDSDRIVIDHPELWWPNELGGQPLYRVSAELLYEGKVLDTWQRRIGLRTLTIRREKDQWGESFCHHINGIDIFAKGADYIPEDNILNRITPERTRALLENAVEAHFNTIRVWGGGFYPPESFYETCDELGLLVWQDFMFACGAFRLDEKSEQNMREEFRDNIIRIRNHPSLALWCGNNEIEEFALKTNGSKLRNSIVNISLSLNISFRIWSSNTIRKHFTGLPHRPPAAVSMIRRIRPAEMSITGMSGTEKSRFPIIESIIFVMSPNLGFKPIRLCKLFILSLCRKI